jgi:hypothetical protein
MFMNDLIEIRGNSFAFEVRDGKKVEYAAGDREARMRALGCPAEVLQKIRHAKRSAKPVARPLTDEECARLNGQTLDEYHKRADANRRMRARQLGREIAASDDVDRRARAAKQGQTIAAEAAQEAKDADLRERMANLAGHTCRTRRK